MNSAPCSSEKVGIVLLNMGGPDSLLSIQPFLTNLFSDREIIQLPGPFFFQKFLARRIAARRTLKVRERYQALGGKSPLLEITNRQAEGLEKLLTHQGLSCKTFVAMRYWHPLTLETVRQIKSAGITELIVLSLYPHYSRATTGSSLNELKRCLQLEKLDIPVTYIDRWFDHPLYIQGLARRINEALSFFPVSAQKEVKIVFSAHSLPRKFIDEGDPYVDHVRTTIELLQPLLEGSQSVLTFQSRSGPVEWVLPDTAEVVVQLPQRGVKNIVMVPISFVSDHIETLYEMDVMYKGAFLAAGGENFYRAAAFNDQPDFLALLQALVVEARREKGHD